MCKSFQKEKVCQAGALHITSWCSNLVGVSPQQAVLFTPRPGVSRCPGAAKAPRVSRRAQGPLSTDTRKFYSCYSCYSCYSWKCVFTRKTRCFLFLGNLFLGMCFYSWIWKQVQIDVSTEGAAVTCTGAQAASPRAWCSRAMSRISRHPMRAAPHLT